MGMPTRLEAFLEPPGVNRLRPCARIHKKSLVPHSSGQWDERQIPIEQLLTQPGMTRTQQLLNNQHPIRLTTEQPYQITILNLDRNSLLRKRLDTLTVIFPSTFQLQREIKFLYFYSTIVNLVLSLTLVFYRGMEQSLYLDLLVSFCVFCHY